MITVIDAQRYSVNGEVAYEITYSDGSKIRAVESKNSIIRKEYKAGSEWKPVGMPYVVKHSKKRDAEKIKDLVNEFLKKS